MRDLIPPNPETVFAVPAPTRIEHPLSQKLSRKFKAGSAIVTKPEALEIANELDRMAARIAELEGAR